LREIKTYYIESRSKGTSYNNEKKERIIGLVVSSVGTVF